LFNSNQILKQGVLRMKELWYVSCSPRNPAKIKAELTKLKILEGEKWNERDKYNNHVTQLKFAKMLKDLAGFEGEASGKEKDFSARDRVAPMKTYGFVYVNSQDKLRITKAGNALINGEDEQHIFLMQLLKWQYPSSQHGSKKYLNQPASLFSRKRLGFSIFPFIFTLQITNAVDGLTKREIAMFLLPHRRMAGANKVISCILKYRQERETKQGRHNKLEYDEQVHWRLYRRLYSEELAKIRNRQGKNDLLNRKIRNSRDVADACIRLFRHTGLFTATRNRLTLNIIRKNEIEVILSRRWKAVTFFRDKERFYKYFGDHEEPELPFLAPQFLAKKALTLQTEIRKLVDSKEKLPKALRFEKSTLQNQSQTKLLRLLSILRDYYRQIKENSITQLLRTTKGQQDVLELYEAIIEKDVTDPATFFEWNSWRAMIVLDDCTSIKSYMKMDDQMQPVNCAGGNVPDILVEFVDYIVAVEVTLSKGRRQYFTEPEPVTYHVGKCQQREKDSGTNRKVYGLFIAPTIEINAANHFLQHVKILKVPECGNVTVIPFSLEQWIDILSFANSVGYLRSHALGELLGSLENTAMEIDDVHNWLESFPSTINTWKTKVMS